MQSDNEFDNIFYDIFGQNEEISVEETCDEYGNYSSYAQHSSDSFNFINEVIHTPRHEIELNDEGNTNALKGASVSGRSII